MADTEYYVKQASHPQTGDAIFVLVHVYKKGVDDKFMTDETVAYFTSKEAAEQFQEYLEEQAFRIQAATAPSVTTQPIQNGPVSGATMKVRPPPMPAFPGRAPEISRDAPPLPENAKPGELVSGAKKIKRNRPVVDRPKQSGVARARGLGMAERRRNQELSRDLAMQAFSRFFGASQQGAPQPPTAPPEPPQPPPAPERSKPQQFTPIPPKEDTTGDAATQVISPSENDHQPARIGQCQPPSSTGAASPTSEASEEKPKKRRGRPPGSKNKKKKTEDSSS